jgi:CRISPR system Cascade subunit CasD
MNYGDSGHSTVFLRLDGPLQSWGDTSKFVIRRSMEAPTKSGVVGLICCAIGLSRKDAHDQLPRLNELRMGVRIDRLGTRWWDYHTVGAGVGMTTAAGGLKTGAQGTLITRREYLADASFLVALQGNAVLIENIADALRSPKWSLYLGRKSCLPSMPVFIQPRKNQGETWTNPMAVDGDVKAALKRVPWCPRYTDDASGDSSIDLPCLIEWLPTEAEPTAPPDTEVWYDVPFSFDPPVHHPRLVMRDQVTVYVGDALQQRTPAPPRPRADYNNTEYKKRREQRLDSDHGLCVFCKSPATTVQHVTYRHAGGKEQLEELRSLCRLCHDAVTMIEYGLGMVLDRINPCDPRWRDDILRTRGEIVRFRSEESRRRALRDAPLKVRREVLEEEDR